MEDSPRENTKRATKALRPLQPVDPVDPDELEDPLTLPDEIPKDADSDASSMDPPGAAAPMKKRYILHCFNIFIYLYIFLFLIFIYVTWSKY